MLPPIPQVELRGVTKSYSEGEQERTVLHGIDLTIEKGAFVVLLGRSGSGKSTLLNLISGLDQPTTGEVWLGGTCLTRLSEHARTLFRRQHIGFVFQSFNLIPTLTVAENVLLPLELNGRTQATERRKALEFLDLVGLVGRENSFPDRLSGGEQQRVAIARAVAHNPLLLLADEPTGNLDEDAGRLVMDLLHRLVRQTDTTLLVVTHDRDLLDASDRVLRLRDGMLVEERREG
jgi:putative ABC transport system ATP-binding protein